MNPETANWLESARYDLETAEHMQKSGRYIYVVFMCHLAIEKTIKALVCEETQAAPRAFTTCRSWQRWQISHSAQAMPILSGS
ncbi:MAG: HEPN domain-containing protein [Armatimonadetes bacterium]|nr:HEPN domain-containing protein [Armatimonadota bacterium]